MHALSGGQRQRALVAQGIARDAQILLLDEPAAGLDAASRERMREILDVEAAAAAPSGGSRTTMRISRSRIASCISRTAAG